MLPYDAPSTPTSAASVRSSGHGLMHKHITHNKRHETFRDVTDAIPTFLRKEVPWDWRLYCDEVIDNSRILSPGDFRILA
jgi:hypothetical protein